MLRKIDYHRVGATVLAGFFATVTACVLFEDVWHGSPLTTAHTLSLGALVAAIAAGHYAWPQLRSGDLVGGALLALLFVGATTYVVVASGTRNAETAAAKAIEAARHAAERTAVQADLADAKSRLAQSITARTKECATGKGAACKGRMADTEALQSHVAVLEGRLSKLGAKPAPNAGYAHLARLISTVPGVTSGVAAIEERLILWVPFLVVLISELGCLAFARIGLHRQTAPKLEISLEPPPADREPRDNVLEFVREYRARHQQEPPIALLQERFRLPKTTAWRRIKAA